MFKMLIDTCVWLDLAKDPKQTPVLGVIEELIKTELLSLIVPRLLVDEFLRNRDRVANESAKSLAAHFRIVKEAVAKAGVHARRTRTILSHLDNVNHRIPLVGGAAASTLDRIEKLLTSGRITELSDSVKLRASQRALDRKAPFHQGKNAMGDAILIETYAESVRSRADSRVRFAFVTHNKSDFSLVNGDQRLPHGDLADIFSRTKSRYFINLPDALRRVDRTLVSDIMIQQSWSEDPRALSDILEAGERLYYQVWYGRHRQLRASVEEGTTKVVEKGKYYGPAGYAIEREIWEGSLKAARRAERRYGVENLGPWSDFDWGMLNGKLSALRWVLGDEWDMLDT